MNGFRKAKDSMEDVVAEAGMSDVRERVSVALGGRV